ncbi:MAG: replicative DNA helicase [bacterium]
MAERIPPHSTDSEQSLLGSFFLSKDSFALLSAKVKPAFFYHANHAVIFEVMLHLFKHNDPIDLVTVADELKKRQKLDEVGGRSYLVELADAVPTAAHAEKYSDIVFQRYLLRELITLGSTIVGMAFDEMAESTEVLDRAQQVVTDMSREMVQDDFVPIKSVLNTVFEDIQSTYDLEDGMLGVPTGFSDFDKMTSGFNKGDLIILAARPSMGKTSLALHFARYAAIQHKMPVAIFSLEMPKEQLALRMLCSESRLDSARLRTAELKEHEYKNLVIAMGTLADAPIYIDDKPGISPLEMKAKFRRLQQETDIKLVLIDYLQLMRSSKKRVESRYQEVSDIVREVKAFAKESQVPVIALSQLSRDVEKRPDKFPLLSDLRESGEIEQTADLVAFIHREETPQEMQLTPGQSNVQLIIAKQRNGPVGKVGLFFKKDTSRFEQLAPHAQPVP